MEKEEQREKEEKAKLENTSVENKQEQTDTKPVIKQDKESYVPEKNEAISDDQFFDDFFGDE